MKMWIWILLIVAMAVPSFADPPVSSEPLRTGPGWQSLDSRDYKNWYAAMYAALLAQGGVAAGADSTIKAADGTLVAGDSVTVGALNCGYYPSWKVDQNGFVRIKPRGLDWVTLTADANVPESEPLTCDSVRVVCGAVACTYRLRLLVVKQ